MENPTPDLPRGIDPGAPGDAPITVAVTRGELVESRHGVDAVVVDTDGRRVARWGEVDHAVYPRSAIKPLQALALIETGAADAFALDEREVALACASHLGEPGHVETVRAWLARLGLCEDDLACGTHWPGLPQALEALLATGAVPGPAHNNCSGKHAGMLSHVVHLAEARQGYLDSAHPAQVRILAAIAEMAGLEGADLAIGIDGCSAPNPALPLAALARAFARLARPDDLAPVRAAACRRIARAMWAQPEMVRGRDSGNSTLLETCAGRVVAKTGAEGVYLAGIVETGLGIAVKARDGAGRAAEVAILALLRRFDALRPEDEAALARFLEPPVLTVRGLAVGEIRATVPPAAAAF